MTNSSNDILSDRLIGLADVVARTTLSKSTIFRHEKAGLFPKRRQISKHRIAWSENELQAWMNRITEIDTAA